MNLKGKKVIVTGGSLGIGKETVLELLSQGAHVIAVGRSMERLKDALGKSNAHLISLL